MNNVIRFTVGLGAFAGVFFLGFLVYQPGFSGPMLFDDQVNLQSTKLYDLGWYSLLDVITHNYSGLFGRGVASLSFGLTHYFHGEGTYYFKYHNFLIHCLTALALFYLGYRLLLITRYAPKALLIASLSALIWFIHPLHVSTVLYIVQRMAQLSALFTICALICYVIGRVRIEQSRRFGLTIIFIGYPLFLFLGLFSKENAALCTLFTLVIEAFFFVPLSRKAHSQLRLAKEAKGEMRRRNQYRWLVRVVFIVLPLVIGTLGVIYKLDSFLAGYDSRPFSLYERLLSQVHILFYYLQLIIFPRLSEYSLYHDDYPIVYEFGWGTFIRLFLILGVLWASLISILKRKVNIILFGIAWFLASHVMESTILPLEMIFEHRNYLALYGVSLIMSILLVILLPRFVSSRKFVQSVMATVCILYLFLLSVRVNTWRTAEQLTLVNVTEHPLSARSHIDRANVLAQYGNAEGAIKHLTIAYQLEPWNPGAAIHRLSAACFFKRLDETIIEEALEATNDAYLTAYTSLAIDNLIVNIESDHCTMEKEDVFALLESFDAGIMGKSSANQARKHFFLAQYYQQLGDVENALKSYDLAVSNDKSMIGYAIRKIHFLIKAGMFEKAENEILLLIEEDKASMRDETKKIRSLFSMLYKEKYKSVNENLKTN